MTLQLRPLLVALLALFAPGSAALAQPAPAPVVVGKVVTDLGLVFVAQDDQHLYEVKNDPWRAHLRASKGMTVTLFGQVQPVAVPGVPIVGFVQVDAVHRELVGRVRVAPGAVALEVGAGPFAQRFEVTDAAWAGALRARADEEVGALVAVTTPAPLGGEVRVLGLDVEARGALQVSGGDVTLTGAAPLRLGGPLAAVLAAHGGEWVSGRFRLATPTSTGGGAATVLRLDGRVGAAAADVRLLDDPTSPVFGRIAATRGVRVVGVTPDAFEVQASSGRRGFVARTAVQVTFPSAGAAPTGPVPGIIPLLPTP